MKNHLLIAGTSIILLCASVLSAPVKLPHGEQLAAFKAAGFKLTGKQWRNCDDPSPSYEPGAIAEVRDVNGDGLPEALITEGGTACYGHTGSGYSLVSKQADGSWKLITSGTGMLSFLPSKGASGWPDIEIGGPGFCFPVERWNGQKYVLYGHQYEGKPCRRK
ncbi:hypothetical protein ACFDR9_002026 [Janthinobacterium sp. CG_23.3]|uniref:hypothetical protein n=1 Tax=Janthinobacterium sp. CG_23.3 TaxID=3349634 RepID=UPI0038D45160